MCFVRVYLIFMRSDGGELREEMAGVCEGEMHGAYPGDEPLTLMRFLSCGLPKLYEAFGWKSVCGWGYNLKGMKGKISFFLFFLKFCFFYYSLFHGMMHDDLTVVEGESVENRGQLVSMW